MLIASNPSEKTIWTFSFGPGYFQLERKYCGGNWQILCDLNVFFSCNLNTTTNRHLQWGKYKLFSIVVNVDCLLDVEQQILFNNGK